MVTKKELLDQLANYKKLGAPPLPFKDRRDLMIVWLIEEKVRKGHSVSRSAQLVKDSKEFIGSGNSKQQAEQDSAAKLLKDKNILLPESPCAYTDILE